MGALNWTYEKRARTHLRLSVSRCCCVHSRYPHRQLELSLAAMQARNFHLLIATQFSLGAATVASYTLCSRASCLISALQYLTSNCLMPKSLALRRPWQISLFHHSPLLKVCVSFANSFCFYLSIDFFYLF